MLFGGYFMYVIFAAAIFLTCSQQHVLDVLALQVSVLALPLFGLPRPKYINIVMYITMTIPLRVVMTEHLFTSKDVN